MRAVSHKTTRAEQKFFADLGKTVPAEMELTRQFLLARVNRVAASAKSS